MSDCLTTCRVRRWLAASQEAQILHLFAEVVNLVNEQDQVVSLVSQHIGAGPFALVLAKRPAWPTNSGAEVCIDHASERLQVGPLTVDYGRAACWQARPAWQRLRAWPFSPPGAMILPPPVARLLEALLDGLCRQEQATVRRASALLAGRGTGLTPTGDDVLVGVLYALWVWQAEGEWARLIAESAAPRTTTLSAAFLEAAAAGEASASWHRLVAGDRDAGVEIRRSGHRSGEETWAGFMAAGARLGHEPD